PPLDAPPLHAFQHRSNLPLSVLSGESCQLATPDGSDSEETEDKSMMRRRGAVPPVRSRPRRRGGRPGRSAGAAPRGRRPGKESLAARVLAVSHDVTAKQRPEVD